jgi:hypothetical protein
LSKITSQIKKPRKNFLKIKKENKKAKKEKNKNYGDGCMPRLLLPGQNFEIPVF